MAKTDDKKAEVSNAAYYHPTGLRMDCMRSQRFSSVLSNIVRSVSSLEACIPNFVGQDIGPGEMDPAQTIRAFTSTLSDDIELAFRMINSEEQPEDSDA